ncbi:GNAT family N-acetyltransferase [Streptococcus catagoni]|uniref:GNAT family N-acetyltransferase n=1 Tax=Streptococcus catagoni TaxID=2654874 RepID=UPI00140D6AD5|nr:GNAT family N-acetyltransferase [Streptococcus catagoni]
MLRTIVEEDASALQQINEFSLGYKSSLQATRQKLKTLLKDNHHYFLAYEDLKTHSLVGYIHAEVYETLYAERGFNVLGLAVLDSFQGRGVGQKLIEALEVEAKKRECGFIRLNSASHREKAHAFYEKVGYHSYKTQKHFIKQMR